VKDFHEVVAEFWAAHPELDPSTTSLSMRNGKDGFEVREWYATPPAGRAVGDILGPDADWCDQELGHPCGTRMSMRWPRAWGDLDYVWGAFESVHFDKCQQCREDEGEA
jgi:hypothetical protein